METEMWAHAGKGGATCRYGQANFECPQECTNRNCPNRQIQGWNPNMMKDDFTFSQSGYMTAKRSFCQDDLLLCLMTPWLDDHPERRKEVATWYEEMFLREYAYQSDRQKW
jgi:hypothetical protein